MKGAGCGVVTTRQADYSDRSNVRLVFSQQVRVNLAVLWLQVPYLHGVAGPTVRSLLSWHICMRLEHIAP